MNWHNLYLKSGDAQLIAAALNEALLSEGYGVYDPFPGGSGTPPKFKVFIKHFVLPTQDGWVRVLGESDQAALRALSQRMPFLSARLESDAGGWQVLSDGAIRTDPADFAPYLRPDKSLDDLSRALVGNAPVAVLPNSGVLPPEVENLAREHKVNPQQADKMMERMTARLFGKLDRGTGGQANAMRNQAQALVSGTGEPDWNSNTGRIIRAMAEVLDLPSNWREPSWSAVRDAVQAARLLARNPKAALMPDERAALQAVPEAGQVIPIYVGR